MNIMKCQIQSHKGQQIISVCMDKQCKNTKLCCLQCMGELHITHHGKCVSIDLLNAFIQQESKKKLNYGYGYGQQQMIQGLENLSNLINSLQKIIMEKIEIIKKQSLQDYIKQINSNQQGIEYWNQFLKGLLQYVEVDNYNISQTTTKEGQLNEIEKLNLKIIKQSEDSLQIILNQIGSTQVKNDVPIQMEVENQNQLKIPKLCFKESRKNVDITIINECTLQKNNTKSRGMTMAMAFANEGFDPNNQSYAFAFIIRNKFSNIWVGVGNDEGGNLPSYLISQQYELGHGQYVICYDNYTFHHTDADINGKSGKGITFTTGDKIQIKYDHVSKELEFRKQSENIVEKMKITDMTRKLYPCALLRMNDSVQLVEY